METAADPEERITRTVEVAMIVLVAALGVPAVLYFAGEQFVSARTANAIALGTTVILPLSALYLLSRRQ